MIRSRQMILGAFFMALGLVLPMIFHAMGLGSIFLPMFWPLALAGFFLNPVWGLMAGALTPVASFLITGMPPVPILYRMIVELAILASLTAVVHRHFKIGVFVTLLISLAASLIIGFGLALLIGPLLGLPPRFYALISLVKGLPGVAAMLLILPPLAARLIHVPVFSKRS